MVSPGASLPQVIYEHSIEASYRGEVLTLVNSELSIYSHIYRELAIGLLALPAAGPIWASCWEGYLTPYTA